MVGLMAKTKIEIANSKEAFLFDVKISFKIIKEKTIAGKSGLGDCKNRNKTGIKKRWVQDFFSKI